MTTQQSPIPGVKELLIGASGAGKTYSIRTLIAAGITPFCIFTEPGQEVLSDVPAEKLKWRYIIPASQSWESMIASAELVNRLSFESLTKVSDPNRGNYDQWVDVLKTLSNFVDERTGEVFGPVDKFNTSRAIVIDSLSGLNIMAMSMVIGGRPTRSQADWGVAQNMMEFLIQKLCTDVRAHVVVIAHPERETDEVYGGNKIMVSTLGKKLAPKIPRFFSDVILAEKRGEKFVWSTANAQADLKNRNLQNSDNLAPSFVQVIEAWTRQGGIVE